jgi:hypothetical protein
MGVRGVKHLAGKLAVMNGNKVSERNTRQVVSAIQSSRFAQGIIKNGK